MGGSRGVRRRHWAPASVHVRGIGRGRREAAQARPGLPGLGDDEERPRHEHEILGPAGAPVERLRGRYVFHLLLRAASDARLESLLSALPRNYSAARLVVDVDPLDVGAMLE